MERETLAAVFEAVRAVERLRAWGGSLVSQGGNYVELGQAILRAADTIDAAFPLAKPVLTSHTEGSAADCREIDDDDGDWIYVYKTGINISGGLDRDTARRVIEEQARVIEELKGKPKAQLERDRVRVSGNQIEHFIGSGKISAVKMHGWDSDDYDAIANWLRSIGVTVEDQ